MSRHGAHCRCIWKDTKDKRDEKDKRDKILHYPPRLPCLSRLLHGYNASMKLAIVTDWLTVFGGAEHVVAEFRKLWPASPLFTTVARPEALGPLKQADIRVTTLQWLYRLLGRHQVLLSLMPRAVEQIDLRGYDVILSSSHAVAKGIVPPSDSVHVCYCHTPMRYAWEMENQYLQDFRVPKFLQKKIRVRLKFLRRWDLATAKRVDLFIANSSETKLRIERIYGRTCAVLQPPVDDRFFEGSVTDARTTFLTVGRLVPYKRFHLVIELANKLGLPLTVIGTGRESARLRAMAGPTITFAGYVSDAELPAYYRKAKAVFFPTHEDAGIVPLEAEASGAPVIAFGQGGARDTVIDGTTGLFFAEQTCAAMEQTFRRFDTMKFDHEAIRRHARSFSSTQFRERMKLLVQEAYEHKKRYHAVDAQKSAVA